VIKNVRADGRIELENPYSRGIKMVTGTCYFPKLFKLEEVTRYAREVKQVLVRRQPIIL